MDRRQFCKMAAGAGTALAVGGLMAAQNPDVLGRARRYLARYDPRLLDISVHLRPDRPYEKPGLTALMQGFKASGLKFRQEAPDTPCGSDIALFWEWKQPKLIADAQLRGSNIFLMERGFIQPRMEWASLAWNGLNGRGTFAPAGDNGQRWEKYFAHHLKPWRTDKSGYALLIGQVPGDASLYGTDINAWLAQTAQQLIAMGWTVVFRPHPNVIKLAQTKPEALVIPAGTRLSQGSLEEDLAGAAFSVMYNSNSAVESVLAGVPAVTLDAGSIAWPVTSHDLRQPFYYPDRLPWCHQMAWRQWTLEELKNGTAWEHVSKIIFG